MNKPFICPKCKQRYTMEHQENNGGFCACGTYLEEVEE